MLKSTPVSSPAPLARILFPLLLGLAVLCPLSARADAPARHADWSVPVAEAQNLYRVTPTFYRSAQLQRSDVALLKSLGIRTVVNLRAFHSDDKWLKDSGIDMARVRINTWSIKDKDVVAALRTLREADKKGPVLLHCMHGADRTGLIVAMYRMIYQNWDKDKALDELTNGGYGYHAMWKNIPRYIRAVDLETIRRQVEETEATPATVAALP